ncbi:GLUG motif-containing protein [Serratia ureilytica]|uniref:two-partner secretion domain-containing protein n=1 Tax=Serratia ureilytica TaxID=300181 RepID=UPI0018D98E4B|nr:GLUG motif-containing protein [Serratia ureilytica]MBH3093047.1 filamentous hemagglutinin N-terminal domain-containing protein [Serratia ureilytica]
MNKIYALVWNHALGCWNVVSENTSRRGKRSSKRRLLVALSLLGLAALEPAHALPSGQNIVAGKGDITTNGQNMTIDQHSDKLITQWDNFNVGGNESVTFRQPGDKSVALNRVVGVNGSDIQGRIDANGKVFIVNPNGVLFGKNAQVNVGGLVVSTRDISDADFMAGKNRFVGSSQAEIVNEGKIIASEASSIALLGAKVNNRGVIQANMGTVALGAGDDITLNFDGNKLLSLQIDKAAVDALASNGGMIRADGGQVLMSARAAGDSLRTVVNNQGIITADTLREQSGRIVLDGGDHGVVNVAGTLSASANAGHGGTIETKGARVAVQSTAKITTRAQDNSKTGNWKLTSSEVNVANGATLDAQTLEHTLENSNVELVSTKGDVAVSQQVRWQNNNKLSLTAERAGIKINAPIKTTGGALALNHKTGYALNNEAAVTLAGDGAAFSVNGEDYKVVQNLAQLLDINKDLSARYVLGNTIMANSRINAIGGNSSFNGIFEGLGNTVQGLEITNSGPYLGLFNSLTGRISNLKLDSLTLIPGAYTEYSGALTGLNFGTVSNVHATRINIRGGGDIGGLVGINFGKIEGSSASGSVTGTADNSNLGGLVGFNLGTIQNSRANVAVSSIANTSGGRMGGLVGQNGGTIDNSSSEGSVSALGEQFDVGGLVGQNDGTIANSVANASVSGMRDSRIGGLAGTNYGKIRNSTANGSVTGHGSYAIGGLVGQNAGVLNAVWANGQVVDNHGRNNVGGLIGVNDKRAQVQNAHAKNTVTGGNNANIGGLIGRNNSNNLANVSAHGKVYGGDASIIGGLVGDNYGNLTETNTESEIYAGKSSVAGGLVGRNNGATISRAKTQSTVTGIYSRALGGLVGENNGGALNDVSANTNVNAGNGTYVGGLVGHNRSGLITRALASGQVNAGSNSRVGGLVGSNDQGSINFSEANVTVTGGNGSYAGGLVGYNKGTLSQVKTQGNVDGGLNSDVGGLVGLNEVGSVIEHADTFGNVIGNIGSAVGGLVGRNGGTIKNSSASGRVDSVGISQRGGLIGTNVGHLFDSSFKGTVVAKSAEYQWVGSLIGSNFGGIIGNNKVSGPSADQPIFGRSVSDLTN